MLILIAQTIKYTMVKKSVYIDKLTEVYNRNYLQESENLINYSNYNVLLPFSKTINL
jgi:GGDEF domain-containing protein